MEEIKVEEINEMLKNTLTPGQYVELLDLMITELMIRKGKMIINSSELYN